MKRRPAYVRDKIALEAARRRADAAHTLPCDCPLHVSPERFRELVDAALARNASAGEEVPF